MRKVLAAVVAWLLFGPVLSAHAGDGSLEVRLGGFFPRAASNLFSDDAELFGTRTSDWTGPTGGVEYWRRVAPALEVGVHADVYGRWNDTHYVDFHTPSGDTIRQTLALTLVPVGFTVRLAPGGGHAPLVPYLGVGPDVIFWDYEEWGHFVDFSSLDVSHDSFHSYGATLGGHAAAGLRIALGHDFGLSTEFRYLLAMKSDMNRDFRASRLDGSGASATVGFFMNF